MMKRWLLNIASMAVIGAVLNVLVAWACVLWAPFPQRKPVPSQGMRWPVPFPAWWPPMPRQARRGTTATLTIEDSIAVVEAPSAAAATSGAFLVTILAAGYPARALRYENITVGPFSGATMNEWTGLRVPSFAGRWLGVHNWERFRLPVSPVWPGLLLNTGVYGLGAGALAWYGAGVRARWRATRSRCVGCGYDLRGNATGTCPECGKAPTT